MSHLEDALAWQIKASGLPSPERQSKIVKDRKFKHDFTWPDYKLAVEVNGGTYVVSGHSTGTGLHRDYEKQNLAALAGWHTMTFDKRMIENGSALKFIQDFISSHEALAEKRRQLNGLLQQLRPITTVQS